MNLYFMKSIFQLIIKFKKDLLYYILDVSKSFNVNTIIAYIYSLDEDFKIYNYYNNRLDEFTIKDLLPEAFEY